MPTTPAGLGTPKEVATAKRRKKLTTEMGRQMLQRERQRLAREQAALGEALANQAKAAAATRTVNRTVVKPAEIGVTNGLIKRLAAVLASEDLDCRIRAQVSDQMSAYTDFINIVIRYVNHDDPRMLAAILRGLVYHEGGHIRFTLPFMELREQATGKNYHDNDSLFTEQQLHRAWNVLEDQRMETAVVSDSPRKAGYFTPMVMTHMVQNVNAAAANYPVLAWRKYLPAHIRTGARKLFVVRHGEQGEVFATAIDAITTDYITATDVIPMWNAVNDMAQVLKAIKPMQVNLDDMGHRHQRNRPIAKPDDNFLDIPIDPSMLGEDGGDEDDDDTEVPELDLTNPEVAWHLAEILAASMLSPETLISIRYVIPQGAPSKDSGSGGDEGDEGDSGAGDLSGDDEGDDEDEGDGGADDKADDEPKASKDKPDNTPGSKDAPASKDNTNSAGKGSHDDKDHSEAPDFEDEVDDDEDDALTDEDLQEAADEAEDEMLNDSALDGDVQSFHDSINERTSTLDTYFRGISTNTAAIAEAEDLAMQIEESFLQATMDAAPAWVEQQRRGVINVSRYITRQPGDREFYRQFVEDDAPGYNIAVSLMCDYSGSMGGLVSDLARMSYATKLACERLDIPCTVTLWDDDAVTLWDANEKAEFLPIIEAAGGTDPTMALADLENQRYEKINHLVVIFTDGEWYGESMRNMLAAYKAEGRWIMGFGYGDSVAASLRDKGADEVHSIHSLMEIPRHIEQALIDMA